MVMARPTATKTATGMTRRRSAGHVTALATSAATANAIAVMTRSPSAARKQKGVARIGGRPCMLANHFACIISQAKLSARTSSANAVHRLIHFDLRMLDREARSLGYLHPYRRHDSPLEWFHRAVQRCAARWRAPGPGRQAPLSPAGQSDRRHAG